MTNMIKDAIQKNNVIFSEKWEATHDRINCHSEEVLLLKNQVVDLEVLMGLQQTALQSCQDTMAGLEETVVKLTTSVSSLEKLICCCRDRLLSPGPHYASGEEEEMVEEMEEEEEGEEEEEEGLEYATDTPPGGSYTTLPSTRGCLSPPALSCCHRTLFLLLFFVHFQPNFTSPSLPHLSPLYSSLLCLSPYAFPAHKQTTRTHLIGTTGHRTTCLLGYQHSETVLLRFLFTWILHWNLLRCHQTLPPLKVPDFPDTEHK